MRSDKKKKTIAAHRAQSRGEEALVNTAILARALEDEIIYLLRAEIFVPGSCDTVNQVGKQVLLSRGRPHRASLRQPPPPMFHTPIVHLF